MLQYNIKLVYNSQVDDHRVTPTRKLPPLIVADSRHQVADRRESLLLVHVDVLFAASSRGHGSIP